MSLTGKAAANRSYLPPPSGSTEIMATRISIPSAVSRAFRSDEILTTPRDWAFNLATFRIVFLLFGAMPLALDFLRWTHTTLPGVAPDMWIPLSFYRFLPTGLLGNVALGRVLAVSDIVLIVLGIVGYRTRSSIALATFISLYGFGLAGNLGHLDHRHHVIWFMALLAAGPSGRFFSLDSLLLARRNADRGEIESSFHSPDALWTLRYIWLLMGLLYLGPGIAKLQSSLTDGWASSVSLRTMMWQRWVQLYWYDPHWVKLVRADLLPAWVLTTLGAGVVAFEIGFIFAVLLRRLRPYLALWGMAFHIGNALVLKIWFGTLAAAYVALIDWTAVWRLVSRRARDPLLAVYDQTYGRCRRMIAILKTSKLLDPLEPMAAVSGDPSRKVRPQITDEMLRHPPDLASTGRHAAGYDAYPWIANLSPLWPISAIMRPAPVAGIGRELSRWVTDSRQGLLPPKAIERTKSRNESVLVHALGVLLLACQLGISSLMFGYDVEYDVLAKRPHAGILLRPIDRLGKRKPVWPFDLYPTFTPPVPQTVEVWEARWVLPSGREVRVSPRAYNHVFGTCNVTWNITVYEMLRPASARQDQERSLHLAHLLWQREDPSIQRNVVAVNIYRSDYRLQAPASESPAELIAQSSLYTFPRSRIE
jgi:hypothetical protein